MNELTASAASHAVLSVEQSVNETIRLYPSTLQVLNAFGVDTCCGGAESLETAARSAAIPIEALMAGINAALERTITPTAPVAGTAPCACRVPSVERRRVP
ncbi:MAG: DUF542 domain-containing protein [bacterium]